MSKVFLDSWRLRGRPTAAAVVVALTAFAGLVVPSGSALADTAPAAGTPETVAADALPTVQIDGVVWSQDVAGNTVYAGGSFATSRPAGSPLGENTVPRPHLLAYDITTGEDIGWAPAPNAQVRSVAVSPDGRRVYVGGDFTSIAGVNRYRIAAFDTATGALLTSFNAGVDAQVRAIAATDTTVYVGGSFSRANNQARTRLAAFSAVNGALLEWDPSANGSVSALAVAPDEETVFVGGSFTELNGSSDPGYGLARVDATTGESLSLPANSVIRNGGPAGAILDLEGDEENVYAIGYTYGREGGTLEGTAAIRWADGELAWVGDCHGDSYSVFPHGGAVYNASHSHYCGNIGSYMQTDPHETWTHYRATAFTKEATRVVGRDPLGYANFQGQPGPTVLNFFPDIDWGTYTRQFQGAWSISGNSEYVVYGGEFTKVNYAPQQGLVRFAVSSVAPNEVGPLHNGSAFPITAEAVAEGAVRVSWQANGDPDNATLVYRVIRNGDSANPVYVGAYDSAIWDRPWMGFTDTGVTPGQPYTYRVTATDPFGNAVSSPTVSVTANGSGSLSAYAQEVLRDGASHYWRLGEGSGSTARDVAAINDGVLGSGVSLGRSGAIVGDADTAADLSTSSGGWVQSNERFLSTVRFSIESWVRPGSGDRGRFVGFSRSNSMTGTSSDRDRHLYLDNSGRINFGVSPAGARVVRSPASYNDGRWHHVVGTMGDDGLQLYVDGELVASNRNETVGANYWGYWRIGGDSLSGWPNRPSNDFYGGPIDEVAIYPHVLSLETIREHHQLGIGEGAAINETPVASFTSSVNGLAVSLDGSASADPDGSIASHTWAFGDGGTATGARASHSYAAAGTYTVTLTVRDDQGGTSSTSRQVSVSAGAIRSLDPARLADTRTGRTTIDGAVAGTGAVAENGVLVVPVTGRGGVPTTGVGSVLLNVTVTEPRTGGVVTAWPSGAPRPNASNVNYAQGQTVANLVAVRPGADGTVSLHSSAGTHMVVDVQGWSPAEGGVAPVGPARLADTRSGRATIDGRMAGTGAVTSGRVLVVPVTGRGGVPTSNVGTVLLNVTVTQPATGGVVTAWPSGTSRPNASNVNYSAGETVANLVAVRPGADGTVSLHTSADTHLVVDVQGWAPDDERISSVDPARLADTREGRPTVDGRVQGTGPVGSGQVLVVPVTGRGGVPATGVGTVLLNVTVTRPATGGVVTAWPSGTSRPNASNVNYGAGETVANLVAVRPGADGTVSLHTSAQAHLVVDVQAWTP